MFFILGFVDILGVIVEIYDLGLVLVIIYFWVIVFIEGCIGGMCNDISNVVIIILDLFGNCCVVNN